MRRLRVVCLLLCLVPMCLWAHRSDSLSVASNDSVAGSEVQKREHRKVFYGMSAHLDVASPLVNYLYDKSLLSFEAAVDVDLLHKYFPTVEVGFGYANKLSDDGIHYRVRAPFYRLGANFNILRMRDQTGQARPFIGCYPYIGLRYGFSLFKYSLSGVMINDAYWHTATPLVVVPRAMYAGWFELVAGVRVDIAKGFTMGWAVRVGLLPHTSRKPDKNQLWYIPGYGRNNTANVMFNYTLGYTFTTKEKNKTKK